MNKIICILCFLWMGHWSFGQAVTNSYTCLSKADAEKILGGGADLADSRIKKTGNATRYTCTWLGKPADSKPGDTCHLTYLVEVYEDALTPKKMHAGMVESNKNMQGFKILDDLGDEASIHSDNRNFMLVMVRKGNKIMRIKINRITSKTSIEGLKKVAEKITNLL